MENTQEQQETLTQAMKSMGLDQSRLVQERKDFLEFGNVDIERIRTLAPFVEKHADRKSTRLNSSHIQKSRMPSSA